MNMFLLYIFSLLIAASLLFTWFKSSLPSLVFAFIKAIGVKKSDQLFWTTPSDINLNILGALKEGKARSPLTWSYDDWAGNESTQGWAQARLGNFFGELLTCRYCLCYHITFWVNLFVFVAYGYIFTHFVLFMLFFLSQPILVHLIFNYIEQLEFSGD